MAKELKVRITFTEELLGSSPSDPEIYKNFVASKSADATKIAEEMESMSDTIDDEEDSVEQGVTVFGRLNSGEPFIWDYQIKGFFKNAAKAYYAIGGDSKLTSFKTKIDNLVFVMERKIPLQLPEGEEIGMCQRPLRAQTARGERIALACSEAVPAGTTAEFTIKVLQKSLMKNVIEWLDYGALNGLGQWHNSGKGRFTWTDISDPGVNEPEPEEEKEPATEAPKKKRGRPKKNA